MPKFMSAHTVPPGSIQREQIDQMAQAAQQDGTVRPYRSFMSLASGHVMCVMEAPDEQSLAAWFEKMQMPVDFIAPVELEGDRGSVHDA